MDSIIEIILALIGLGLGYLFTRYAKIKQALALLGVFVEYIADAKLTKEELDDLVRRYKELTGSQPE